MQGGGNTLGRKVWEDFDIGQKVNTVAITVTETHIVNFAGVTGDFYYLHMNEEYMKKTPFGGRIAHGPLTFCLAVGLVERTNILADSLIGFLGANNLRFPAAVKPGDTIHVEVEIIGKRETSKSDRGVVTMQYIVKNQREEIVATVEMNFMMYRK
jgi:acyl dehydratase